MVAGDRDTLGAMACAVSGAYPGVDAVSARRLERLETLSRIEDLSRPLGQLRQRVNQDLNSFSGGPGSAG